MSFKPLGSLGHPWVQFIYIEDVAKHVSTCANNQGFNMFQPGGGSQIQTTPGREAAASEGGPSPRRSDAAWPAEPL